MSQMTTENDDDNRSVAASDFVQFDQPDEVSDQQEVQQQHQQGQQQFGLHQNALDWTMNTGSTITQNYANDLKDLKFMIANLEAKNQTLQAKVEKVELMAQERLENLELKAEIRAVKENAEQKTKYQALEDKLAQMLATQNEQQKEMEQLKSKNRMLEQKVSTPELQQTTENGDLDGKMDQFKDEFEKMVSDKIVALRTEMNENDGNQAIDENQLKLDYIWDQLMIKSKKLANPKGFVWDGSKTGASISEYGLKVSDERYGQIVFATEGYVISGEQCRKNYFPFPGTIVLYYEVTLTVAGWPDSVGFSDGKDGGHASTNSYAIYRGGNKYDEYWLSGKQHKFESPAQFSGSHVVGCGLLLNCKNEWAVFFTLNGQLLGKPAPINPTVDLLYPTVLIYRASAEANFGDNLVAKPFKFDIDNCPGLVFE